VSETADLKSLARIVIERDIERDSEPDRVSRGCLAIEARPRQELGTVSLSHFPKERDSETAIPTAYLRVFGALRDRCPDLIDAADWERAVVDGDRFLRHWGDQAQALGWSAADLFGLYPAPDKPAPAFRRLSRYDATGLVWLLRGRAVVALTATTAMIRTAAVSTLTYRRLQKPAQCVAPLLRGRQQPSIR
jgi:hypothetical protein